MSTPYTKVFDSFLSKIDDPLFAKLTTTEAEDDMTSLLNSAIVQFDFPRVSLVEKDDVTKIFTNDLSLNEIEILANLMKLEWIKREIHGVHLIQQQLSSKDFGLTSQANHLKILLELKVETEKDVQSLLTKYSYVSNRQSLYEGLAGDN
jgi:hypothetical protein